MGNKNQKKKINWQLTVAICSVVTTLVIGTFAVIYSHNTNKILEEQTKIIHLQSEILKIFLPDLSSPILVHMKKKTVKTKQTLFFTMELIHKESK